MKHRMLALLLVLLATSAAPAFAAVSVVTEGRIQENQYGIEPGLTASTTFMVDTTLQPVEPGIFIDPWRWHFDVARSPWDWLDGFIIEIEIEIPIPGPDPGPYDVLRVIAKYDDPEQDMVMDLELGSQFVQELYFEPGTLRKDLLPPAAVLKTFLFSEMNIFDPSGESLLRAEFNELHAADSTVDVKTRGKVLENQLGVEPGLLSEATFMYDLAVQPVDRIVIDPWQFHWDVNSTPWDWLNGFVIEVITEIPWPGPGPGPDPGPYDVLRVYAEFDNPEDDMVMDLPLGSRFYNDFAFPPHTLNPLQLPDADTLQDAVFASMSIVDPTGEVLLLASIDEIGATDSMVPLSATGVIGDNQLGLDPGTESRIDFSLDVTLVPIDVGVFRDPWWLHWTAGADPWDWLEDFDIIIEPEVPLPDFGINGGGNADRVTIVAVYDDPERDMAMGLEVGSRFVQELYFPPGSLSVNHLPSKPALDQFIQGSLRIEGRDGEVLLSASVDDLQVGDGMDVDMDGVEDAADNCIHVPNVDQTDADVDGFGNACDFDLTQNCSSDFDDVAAMKSVFFSDDPVADLDLSGTVDFGDVAIAKTLIFNPPGPSGVPNECDNN